MVSKITKDQDRETRIEQEVVVDAHDESERAMGWYYYLADKLQFPFKAKCIAQRPISPLVKNEEVRIEAMGPEEECEKEMFVKVLWRGRKLVVPLSQLEGLGLDDETQEAIGDWHYWVARGYEF